jgi:hypothetical protein
MGDSLDDELAALRARTYGPDADIHDDPDALARLHELEEQQRARRLILPPLPSSMPGPLPASRPTVTPSAGTSGTSEASEASESPASPGATSSPPARVVADPTGDAESRPPRRPFRRMGGGRTLMACAITAVAVAAVTVPITLWSSGHAERPYAVLTPAVGPPNNVFFSPESNPKRYEDFLGIQISVGELDYMQGERCILIELEPSEGIDDDVQNTRGSCSPPGFGAIVDVPAVDGYLSDEVRDQLGDITALRFEVVGDEVHVFVAHVPEPAQVDDES